MKKLSKEKLNKYGKELKKKADELGEAGRKKAEELGRRGSDRKNDAAVWNSAALKEMQERNEKYLAQLKEKSEIGLEELKEKGIAQAEYLVKKKRTVIMCIIVIIGAMISIAQNLIGLSLGASAPHDIFGIVIVSSLCGTVPGIFSVILLFVYKVLVQTSSIYNIAIYFFIAVIASATARQGIYRSKFKTSLVFVAYSFLSGATVLINHIVVGNGLTTKVYMDSLWAFLLEMPFCFMTVCVIYAVLNFCPEGLRIYFSNALFYSNDEVTRQILHKRVKERMGLSRKITTITMAEAAVLAISASAFANLLIGNMDFTGAVMRNLSASGNIVSEIGERAQIISDGLENPDMPVMPPEPPEKDDGRFFEKMLSGNMAYMPQRMSGNEVFTDREAHFNEIFRNRNLSAENQLAFIMRLIMLLFAFSILTGLIANFLAQKTIAEPIKKISGAMSAFAYDTGDMRVGGTDAITSLKIHTKDEIEELYNAILKTVNDMNGYLERIEAEEEMENALKVAQAANEAKSNFLSSMSHEIRTPINAVLGFDEMILMENDNPDIEKYAEDIQSAGRTLLSLINDILDFSKIEAGKMNIVPVEYELCSTINDMINMASSLARDKGLYLDVNVDSKMPHLLYGDEVRLKQIMLNILTNAVKYTEKGGVTFNVGFEKIDDENIYFIVSVRDTGIGIKEEDMDKLFSPFERLDEQKNSAVKGTGLGMSITKQLLSKMDSKLEVESVYGEGSNFSFKVIQKVTKWEEVGNLSEAFKKYLPHEADKHKNDNFFAPDARILVVDDTEFNLLVVTRLLKRTKIRIDTAASGKETLDLICKNRYDIVYIDHMMPQMDGIETFKAMKGLEGNLNADIPWIVLTANAVSGAREKYMAEGFTDYMTKPVNYLTLKNSLIKYLPGEKITETTDGEDNEKTEASKECGDECDCRLKELMDEIPGIDYEEGIKNSDCEEILLEVIRGYHDSIDEKSATIEDCLNRKDYKNYTIFVHALKSSSRLIGAMELSGLAADMEAAGNAVQENEEGSREYDEAVLLIREKTPELLSVYRGFKNGLACVVEEEETDKDDRPEIAENDLMEIVMAVCEFADAFDFDSADSAVKELENYSIPEKHKENIKKLKTLVRNIDRDGIIEFKENL